MSIDERLEKLAERHEALTQSVELLTADVQETAKSVSAMVAENRERNVQVDKRFAETMAAITALARIAESHEHRLTGLEGGAQ
jgi:hypothetical protein